MSETQEKCQHRLPLESSYGFGRVSGWRGIGVTYRCPDCYETLWFDEDYESFEDEIEHNKIKKEENKHWGEAVARGDYT
ncbi:MAG TPA: hypothetical protein DCE71_07875 [Parachlamydiales bacterium]|nr:hypothetical protein [Parachlamydiales bacterium]